MKRRHTIDYALSQGLDRFVIYFVDQSAKIPRVDHPYRKHTPSPFMDHKARQGNADDNDVVRAFDPFEQARVDGGIAPGCESGTPRYGNKRSGFQYWLSDTVKQIGQLVNSASLVINPVSYLFTAWRLTH